MDKLFFYGFKLEHINEKIGKILSEEYIYSFYGGYNKIKYSAIKNKKLNQKESLKKIIVAFLSTLIVFFKILKFKPKYTILASSKPSLIAPLVFLFKRFTKIVYFPYDVMCLIYDKYEKNSLLDRISEKYCYKYCNGIIFKGVNEDLYVSKRFDISKKLVFKIHLLTLKDCIDAEIENIAEDVHVCDVCSTLHSKDDLNYYDEPSMLKILLDKKIHVHVYTKNEFKYEFKDLLENSFFHFEGYVSPNNLIKEISKYHYGLHIDFLRPRTQLSRPWIETTLGNRQYDYLQAGIVQLATKGGAIGNFAEKNELGFCLSLKEYKSLKKSDIIKKWSDYRKNIPFVRNKLAFENQLIEFNFFLNNL